MSNTFAGLILFLSVCDGLGGENNGSMATDGVRAELEHTCKWRPPDAAQLPTFLGSERQALFPSTLTA